MTMRSCIRGWIAGTGLLVSAWSALPTLQWCGLAWRDVPLQCLLADAATCAVADDPTVCQTSSCGEPPSSCGPESSTAITYPAPTADPRERAWCPAPGAPKIAPQSPAADEPIALAVLPDPTLDLEPAHPRWFHGPWIAEARPPTPPGRIPPSIRAPPAS